MESSWEVKSLVDCTIDGNISYGIVQPGQHDNDGIPILRINNIKNGRLELDDVLRVSKDIEVKYSRTRLEGGEVLLTLVGSTGQSLIVPKEMKGWNIPRAIAVIRPRPEIGAKWINLILQTVEVKNYLDSRANTTVQKTLNLKDVREIQVKIPPRNIREEIENRAYAITSKLQVSDKLNSIFESISQALYKSWFVDFDPVRAKVAAKLENKDPQFSAIQVISGKSAEELSHLPSEKRKKLAETVDLFPDEFEQTQEGEIPKGWKWTTIESLAEHNKSVINPGGSPTGQFYHYSIPAFDNGCYPSLVLGDLIKSNKYLIGSDSILVSKLNPSTPRIWDVINPQPNSVCSTEFQCFVPKKSYQFEFLSSFLKSEATIERLSSLVTGTSKSHQRVRPSDMLSLKVVSPTEDLLKRFSELTKPQYQLKNQLTHEQFNLAQLRDSMLPKLLTGSLKMVE